MKGKHTVLPFVLLTVCVLLMLSGCGNPLANTQWEYKIVPLVPLSAQVNDGDILEAESHLNSLGKLGWECDAFFNLANLLCKRPLMISEVKW